MEDIFSVSNLCSVDSGERVIFSLRNVEICRGADEVDRTLQSSMRMPKPRHPPGRVELDLALSSPWQGSGNPAGTQPPSCLMRLLTLASPQAREAEEGHLRGGCPAHRFPIPDKVASRSLSLSLRGRGISELTSLKGFSPPPKKTHQCPLDPWNIWKGG